MNILITGVAGFIGYNFALYQLKNNKKIKIYGLDNFDDYYSKKIKKFRVLELKKFKNFSFKKIDITHIKSLNFISKKKNIKIIYHFAAQAGVRYSVVNPQKYVDVNIKGYINLLETAKKANINKVIYASSSSVYGDSKEFPLKEDSPLKPKSIYALSKILNEKYSEQIAVQNKIKFIGLRFFTVYGEFGRPDMFIGKLISKINNKSEFKINNNGNHSRDFTYIGDVCLILSKLSKIKLKNYHTILNICSSNPINILKISEKIFRNYGKTKTKFISLNDLDVIKTHGDNKKIKKLIKNLKFTDINSGLDNTIKWFKESRFAKYY